MELVWTVCDRCGGHGTYAMGVMNGSRFISPIDNGICYKCKGTGRVQVRQRTKEEEARLEERRAKRQTRKEAEALKRESERPQREAERMQKALETCNANKFCKCAGCKHRAYCSLLTEAIEKFSKVETNSFISDILSINRNAVVWENVEIVTLAGEPCKTSSWYKDSYGNMKRTVTMPNGKKVYTSAKTDEKLARLGLKNYTGRV